MKKLLQKDPWVYLVVFVSAASVMTLYEFVKELIFKGTLTPWESHTITIIVTAFLATFAARITRTWAENLQKKEQILRLREQRVHTLSLILRAVHHIVNNFLNHFQLIKNDISKTGAVRADTLELLDASIEEVTRQLKILEELEEPEKKDSYRAIFPE